MIAHPYPQLLQPTTVNPSPLGLADQQILQAETTLNNLIAQYNQLVQQFNQWRNILQLLVKNSSLYVTSIVGTANQIGVSRSGSVATVSLTTNVAVAGYFESDGGAASGGFYLNNSHDVGIVYTGSGNMELLAASSKYIFTNNDFHAANFYLEAAGNYYANSGNVGVSGSFGSPVACVFENGLLTAGDPTSGGGSGSGVPDVPFDSGTHVMYVRQSVTTPGPGGDWESLDTYFSGIAPSTKWPGSSDLTTLGTIATGTWGSGATTIAIASGGTGATTAAAAFDALSPGTTEGDIVYVNSTPSNVRLAANSSGTNKYLQSVSSGVPAWEQVAMADLSGTAAINQGGTGATTNTAAFDALAPSATTGEMLYMDSGGDWTVLAVGSTNTILTIAAGIPSWSSIATLTDITVSPGSDGACFAVENHAGSTTYLSVNTSTGAVKIGSDVSITSNVITFTSQSTTITASGGGININGPLGLGLHAIFCTGITYGSGSPSVCTFDSSGNATFDASVTIDVNLTVNGGQTVDGTLQFGASGHLILPTS